MRISIKVSGREDMRTTDKLPRQTDMRAYRLLELILRWSLEVVIQRIITAVEPDQFTWDTSDLEIEASMATCMHRNRALCAKPTDGAVWGWKGPRNGRPAGPRASAWDHMPGPIPKEGLARMVWVPARKRCPLHRRLSGRLSRWDWPANTPRPAAFAGPP